MSREEEEWLSKDALIPICVPHIFCHLLLSCTHPLPPLPPLGAQKENADLLKALEQAEGEILKYKADAEEIFEAHGATETALKRTQRELEELGREVEERGAKVKELEAALEESLKVSKAAASKAGADVTRATDMKAVKEVEELKRKVEEARKEAERAQEEGRKAAEELKEARKQLLGKEAAMKEMTVELEDLKKVAALPKESTGKETGPVCGFRSKAVGLGP